MSDPTQVKHYEILSRLGEGGMGVVYRARDTRLGRTVALKMLSGGFALDAERTQRFEREARIVSSMSHPGIATLFDFDREGDSTFLTMELVEGPTLRKVLEDGPMPGDKLLDCASQVADAVAAAHQHGVVHRDLKPENIMITGSGFYKVLDFGVARIEDPEEEDDPTTLNTQTPTRWLTRRGMLMGTVAYMSPEQVKGEIVDAHSDVFALGSVLYELATGQPAFAQSTEVATLHSIAYEQPQSLRELRPDLSRGLELVIGRCLAKNPGERYASAAELAADLNLLKQSTQSSTGAIEQLEAFRRRQEPVRKIPLWLAGVAGAALLVTLGWLGSQWLFRTEDPMPAPARIEAPRPVAPAALNAVAVTAPPRVIVAFFENHTGETDADWITSGLPEMLTTDLSRSKELEMIATQRLHDLLARAGHDATAPLDRSTTAELARWADADLVISGAVFMLGDQYRIDAQAYDVATGTMTTAYKVSGTQLLDMVDELSAGMLQGLTSGDASPPSLQAVTHSEEAFRAFSEGKSLYANLQYDEAAERFRDSIELDTEFAMPRVHLATTLFSVGDVDGGVDALGDALADPQALSEDDRMLAEGLDAFFREEDFAKGSKIFGQLIERFPRNPEAYVWLGRAASELEGDSMEGIRQLRAALKIDRDYLPAVASLAGEMTRLGAVNESQALLKETADRCPMAADAIEALIE